MRYLGLRIILFHRLAEIICCVIVEKGCRVDERGILFRMHLLFANKHVDLQLLNLNSVVQDFTQSLSLLLLDTIIIRAQQIITRHSMCVNTRRQFKYPSLKSKITRISRIPSVCFLIPALHQDDVHRR